MSRHFKPRHRRRTFRAQRRSVLFRLRLPRVMRNLFAGPVAASVQAESELMGVFIVPNDPSTSGRYHETAHYYVCPAAQ